MVVGNVAVFITAPLDSVMGKKPTIVK